MIPLVSHVVANAKDVTDKVTKESRSERDISDSRFDKMHFNVISGSDYDALSAYDSSCIYVVNRTDHYELYKGNIRILVGQGTTYKYGIVLKTAETQ